MRKKDIHSAIQYIIYLLKYLWRQPWFCLFILLLTVVQVSYYIAFPTILDPLIHSVTHKNLNSNVEFLLIILFSIYLLHVIAGVFNTVFRSKLLIKTMSHIKLDLLDSLLLKDHNIDGSKTNYNLMSHFTTEASDIESALAQTLPGLLTGVLQFIFGLATLIYLNWKLSLIPIIFSFFIVFITRPLERRANDSGQKRKYDEAENNEFIAQVLANFVLIKIYKLYAYIFKRQKVILESSQQAFYRNSIYSGILGNAADIYNQFLILIVVMLGFMLVKHHLMQINGLVAFILLMMTVSFSLNMIIAFYTSLLRTIGSVNRIAKFINQPLIKDVSNEKNAVDLDSSFRSIQFKDVTYSYENNNNASLLNINLVINANERVAILGKNGSGKSTLLKVMLGEITDYSGKVTVNGIEQSQLNFDSWYEKLGLVLQDIKLFNSSILDNLTLDSNAIPKSNIVAICKMIEIDKDIQHMPHKYDSIISSLGRSLSGGQRQRIAIAQALLRKPEILIMDEPTSDLDYHSAKAIWNLFNFYNDPITLITITHDLNKLDIFDRVIILKEGKITQILTKSEVKHIGKDIAKLL